MNTPVEKLRKILKAETEKFEDRAVIGGLARFADTWTREATTAFGSEASAWVQAIADRLRAYSQLSSRPERVAALEELFRLLKAGPSAGAPPAGPPRPVERAQRPPHAPPAAPPRSPRVRLLLPL